MSTRRQELMDKIEHTHDMQPVGQPYQWEACGVHGIDRCTICGLTHDWYRNGQNSPDSDQWSDLDDNEMSLAEAARRECD